MGIDPARDLAAVVLTHFHHDHTGGLDHFPHTRIIGPRANHAVSTGLRGMVMGCLPQRWPVWLKPELVDPPIGPFPASHPLTRDGRIALVPTPGHVAGHCSVIVRDDDITRFIAGDATYSQDNLQAERTDGVTNDIAMSLATLRAIKAFAALQPTVVLPAHDPDACRRLDAREIFAVP